MIEKLRNLVWDEEGQGLIEYGLIIALISLIAIVAMSPLGQKIASVFTSADTKLVIP